MGITDILKKTKDKVFGGGSFTDDSDLDALDADLGSKPKDPFGGADDLDKELDALGGDLEEPPEPKPLPKPAAAPTPKPVAIPTSTPKPVAIPTPAPDTSNISSKIDVLAAHIQSLQESSHYLLNELQRMNEHFTFLDQKLDQLEAELSEIESAVHS